ncbi:MAG TPA: arginine--tRNA ligase [Terracidiphilus sp.]|nr:arginine--tRNA ligase [Terracidiphilus sp.]
MVLELQKQLGEAIRAVLKEKYDLQLENIPLETPPDLRFGEMATPIALQLARTLRKAPKVIAQEIVAALGAVEGFAGFEVAGAGYINARLDRAAAVRAISGVASHFRRDETGPKVGHPQIAHVLVEHTSINPNKAAHIGHLRNAILGDTFVRLLRAAGHKVDVQNYIDNTGVQVADVVVGFLHLENKSVADVRQLVADCERRAEAADGHAAAIDYYCWDLYARTSQWYEQGSEEEKASRKKLRYETLHLIEHGGNETAEVAELVSTAVLRRHLETMLRLGIEYDFLPRESEILHLKFWEAAFEQLKRTGVLYFETEGKNKGCWVMARPGSTSEPVRGENDTKYVDEDAKVIVRSNGTVTYVGKDIAYHLWKFRLLGRDFGYKPFFEYPDHECWISTEHGEAKHPHFGGAQAIYNVIDSRQSDPQANVIQALRGMGHNAEADRYTHFSYEMVALTPRCAVELGYQVPEEDLSRPYIEVSGRKGFGVKADDLIDKLIAAVQPLVDEKQAASPEPVRRKIAEQIAIGALRYFMLKYTRNSVIAFDFKDALSFEGETGPYIQYAAVRIRNIFRKGGTAPEAVLAEFGAARGDISEYLAGNENEDIWSLWLRAGRFSLVLDQCIAASEPAYLAKHAFQLAQEFATFYHNHHILTEEDASKKTFLLATAAIALRELIRALALLGIESPEAM